MVSLSTSLLGVLPAPSRALDSLPSSALRTLDVQVTRITLTPIASQPTADVPEKDSRIASVAVPKGAVDEIARYRETAKLAKKTSDSVKDIVGKLGELTQKSLSGNTTNQARIQLDKQAAELIEKLKKVLGDATIDGKYIFSGTFELDAKQNTLAAFLNPNVKNSPTAEQSTLTLPKINLSTLLGDEPFSLLHVEDAAKAFTALSGSSAVLDKLPREIGNFQLSLDYAENAIFGRAQNLFSITQLNIAEDAETAATAATNGVNAIATLLNTAKGLATTAANPNKTDIERAFLQQQLQVVLAQIDVVAKNTRAGGTRLLDGTFTTDISKSLKDFVYPRGAEHAYPVQPKLVIPNVGTQGLFAKGLPSILTQKGAELSLDLIAAAERKIYQAHAQISRFADTVAFARSNFYPKTNLLA